MAFQRAPSGAEPSGGKTRKKNLESVPGEGEWTNDLRYECNSQLIGFTMARLIVVPRPHFHQPRSDCVIHPDLELKIDYQTFHTMLKPPIAIIEPLRENLRSIWCSSAGFLPRKHVVTSFRFREHTNRKGPRILSKNRNQAEKKNKPQLLIHWTVCSPTPRATLKKSAAKNNRRRRCPEATQKWSGGLMSAGLRFASTGFE